MKVSDIEDILHPEQIVADNGIKSYAIVKRTLVTKEVNIEGQTIRIPELDSDGQKQYTYSKQAIKDGAWTIAKFAQLILTARELNKLP